jgi:hypothetical protein
MSQPLPTYEVYLDTEGVPLDLTSPVRTTDVMYYDSGIWMGRDEDRIFVPYHQVEAIREVEEPEPATDDETEGTGDPETKPTEGAEAEPTDEPPSDPVE